MKETWANILQTRMEGYKEPAPEGLWDSIEAGLAATAVTATAAVAAKGLVHAKHLTHLKWFLGADTGGRRLAFPAFSNFQSACRRHPVSSAFLGLIQRRVGGLDQGQAVRFVAR